MYEYTERLKLPLLIPNQSGKEITHNEALIIIDNLLQNHVMSKSLNTPPDSSNSGDIYIVSNNATGDWFEKENQLAIFDNGWRFLEPINGMLFYILDENCFYAYKDNWIKLEYLIDFTKLQNIAIDNLQKDELIKYDGNDFVNTREINLLKLYINNKLLIDENLNISIKNEESLNNIVSITSEDINFKNNLKISGVGIDNYIINVVNTNINGFANIDLSNLSSTGQTYIKSLVDENTLNINVSNITQTGIDTIMTYNIPDYSAGVSVTEQQLITGYTSPSKGILYITAQSNVGVQVYVNDVYVTDIGAGLRATTIILDINDVVKVSIASDLFKNSIFFPFKGVNND